VASHACISISTMSDNYYASAKELVKRMTL
jgi:hypothetical protein